MKNPSRAALAAAAACVVLLPAAPAAWADPHDPVPSQSDVDRAQQDVAGKQRDVAAIEADLAEANDELNRTGAEAEMASERYNGAVWKLGEAKKSLAAARSAEKKARQQVADQRDDIARMLTQNYRSSTTIDRMRAFTTSDGPENLMDRYGAVSGAGASMDHTYDEYTAAQGRAAKARTRAVDAEGEAERLTDTARQDRAAAQRVADAAQARNDEIARHQSELMDELAQAQGVSRRLAQQRQAALEARAQAAREAAAEKKAQQEAAEQAAKEAAAKAEAQREAREKAEQEKADQAAAKAAQEKADREAAAAARRAAAAKTAQERSQALAEQKAAQKRAAQQKAARETAAQKAAERKAAAERAARKKAADKKRSSSRSSSSSSGSSSRSVSAMISFAKAQIGDPYQWAATGPSSWDCSGLTMKAWEAGGKSIPRNSAMQYAAIDHISRSELKPGDLVFWGSSPGGIHHVAIYIGDGEILHAPRTGRDVEIDSIDYWIPPNYFGRVD